jgi:hypothetical protein
LTIGRSFFFSLRATTGHSWWAAKGTKPSKRSPFSLMRLRAVKTVVVVNPDLVLRAAEANFDPSGTLVQRKCLMRFSSSSSTICETAIGASSL